LVFIIIQGIDKRQVGDRQAFIARAESKTVQGGRQAGGLRVRTDKGQNQEDEKKRDWEKQELRHKNAG
jgi:hypothetical protein